MSRIYDNWERLVEATLDREKLRQLALCESFSSSISADFSSRFSFDSPDVYEASRNSNATIPPEASSSQSTPTFALRPITFKEIKKATRNFHANSILGEGAFGRVYKGWINESSFTAAKPGYGMAIAVKKSKQDSFQGNTEWLAEVNYLGQLHHPNLVKLIGYCSEENNLSLVYEFMPRGSLDNHLFRRAHRSLSWATRMKVAIGAARALSFLHDMEMPVIHRGFNTSDILLDGEFNAKLSDFGLAKDGPTGEMTHISTRVMGRTGYPAPEYIATGHLTAKCDVYAFGAALLELLAGRRFLDITKVTTEQNLVDWAKSCLVNKRMFFPIMDTKLEGQYPQKEAYSVALLALKCLDQNPKQRPKMSEVLVELEKL